VKTTNSSSIDLGQRGHWQEFAGYNVARVMRLASLETFQPVTTHAPPGSGDLCA
jgi:hypothetical protein